MKPSFKLLCFPLLAMMLVSCGNDVDSLLGSYEKEVAKIEEKAQKDNDCELSDLSNTAIRIESITAELKDKSSDMTDAQRERLAKITVNMEKALLEITTRQAKSAMDAATDAAKPFIDVLNTAIDISGEAEGMLDAYGENDD